MEKPMKRLGQTFLTGLGAILPIAVTLALLVWLGTTAEDLLGSTLRFLLPESGYFPGLGVIAGLGVVFAVGVLMRAYVVQGIFGWLESLLQRIPLIKTLYGTMRDLMGLFSGGLARQFGGAVVVQLPGTDYRLIGFVTRSDFSDLPDTLGQEGTIAVYLPMSYQVGGYTVMLPRSSVTPLELSVEDAMRFTLTAGVSARAEKTDPSDAGNPQRP